MRNEEMPTAEFCRIDSADKAVAVSGKTLTVSEKTLTVSGKTLTVLEKTLTVLEKTLTVFGGGAGRGFSEGLVEVG